jgi:NAD(P)-dependent dehydrogenase (short-subunit alcohol dehydrogenase family)
MAAIDASTLLRPGLLQGACVLVAGGAGRVDGDDDNDVIPNGSSLGAAVEEACAELGAHVARCAPILDAADADEDEATDELVSRALADAPALDVLVVDATALIAQAGHDGDEPGSVALGACLRAVWTVTRSAFNLALLPGGRGGRIVYLAPPPGAGEHSEPARAALENLARTLSIEWARHGVTAVAIAPGQSTSAGEVAALCAYLASPAGAYFSGCLLDLRGPAGRHVNCRRQQAGTRFWS